MADDKSADGLFDDGDCWGGLNPPPCDFTITGKVSMSVKDFNCLAALTADHWGMTRAARGMAHWPLPPKSSLRTALLGVCGRVDEAKILGRR